jgi:3-dehydroquinate dehydratase-1
MFCVSLFEDSAAKILLAMQKHDFFEIRLDELDLSESEFDQIFGSDKQTIATCRPGNFDHKKRTAILTKAIEAGSDYVDIEIDSSSEYIKKIVDKARINDYKVILSYHNEEGMDSLKLLFDIIKHAEEFEPDIIKIACLVQDQKECAKLMALYSYFDNLIVIAMGDAGKISRIAAHSLGAPFIYCALDEDHVVAHGQLTIDKHKELQRLIDEV